MKSPDQYIQELAAFLAPVGIEEVEWQESVGRILAETITAERDSPAADVSAMDGYAVRSRDISHANIPIFCTIAAGYPPSEFPPGTCARIFTGGMVPRQADVVIRCEDVIEEPDSISIRSEYFAQIGDNIRRQGENATKGSIILGSGITLNQANLNGVLSGGNRVVQVHRRVRIGIINTGDELVDLHQPLEPWQIRDSNGPTLEFFCRQLPWVELLKRERVADSREKILQQLTMLLPKVDAIFLTGGVSMGGTDHVPHAIQEVGAKNVFHRIPIRPGKPILGAATRDGKLILGLPGNPVSVAVTALRFGLPLIRKIAGLKQVQSSSLPVRIRNCDSKTIPLTWYRLATINIDGTVSLIDTHGSGDLISLANSDGVVEIAPGCHGQGPFPWYPWTQA